MSVSFIVPTIGRPTLARALESIRMQMQTGDEVLVATQQPDVEVPAWCRHLVIPVYPKRAYGGPERRAAMAAATGTHLAFMDDDDIYLPGARVAMADAIDLTPDVPVIFRMRIAETGDVLWKDLRPYIGTNFKNGNLSSQMLLVPNSPARLGAWTDRRCGDFEFLNHSRWPKSRLVWREDVIAEIRPDAPAVTDASDPRLTKGNFGSPMLLVPNVPARMGAWLDRYTADYYFLARSRWRRFVWRPEVIALIRPEATC